LRLCAYEGFDRQVRVAATAAARTGSLTRNMTTEVIAQLYVGALTLDLLLGDVRSLKQKRSVIRPILAEVQRRFPGVAVAETGNQDLHRRAEIGVAVVSADAANCGEVLDACERLVAGRPEIDLLSARQRLFSDEE
jgi:uncharacterized protein YlxP (DUF503 family)